MALRGDSFLHLFFPSVEIVIETCYICFCKLSVELKLQEEMFLIESAKLATLRPSIVQAYQVNELLCK